MEGFTFRRKTGAPLYIQIAEHLKKAILRKQIPEGTKLSGRTLAEMYGVSRRPVAEAFELLEAEGLVETQPQSGTKVTGNLWLLINSKTDSLWNKYMDSGRQRVSPKDVFNAFRNMDDKDGRVKMNGDRISSTFNPELVFAEILPKVAIRLKESGDMSQFSMGGLTSLKKALCEHMKTHGICTTPDQVVVTSGIGESLSMIAGAFLGGGIDFFYETPSFLNTAMIIHSTGANMIEIPMDSEGIDINILLPKLRRSKSAVLYMQPVNHNPTGIHITKARKTSVLAACKEFGVPIIENDMFRDFVFERPYTRPLKAFDNSGQIIYIGSFMSCFMGFKLSWIVAPDFITERLEDMKRHYELMSNVFVEIVAEEILNSGIYRKYFDGIRPLMIRQYTSISGLLEKHLGGIATWTKDNPSYFIWLKFNENLPGLAQRKPEEYLFFPGVIFDWKDNRHARLNTMGVKYEELENWIIKIKQFVTEN